MPLLFSRRGSMNWRHVVFVGVFMCVLTTPFVVHAQDKTQGTSCSFPATGPISGSTTGTSVVSPAAGNNLVCISGTWQYPTYQFGSTTASCNSTNAGAMQWTGSVL